MQPWQHSLANAITQLDELLDILNIDEGLRSTFCTDMPFPLLVTREFVKRMRKGDVHDPLFLQVVPRRLEQQPVAGFDTDPLQEKSIIAVPGVLHRYPRRVLLTLTAACPVHCRYCFRRHFPYADNNPLKTNFPQVIDYIKNDTSIEEVIYSGGDPLLIHDTQLITMSKQIAAIEHVRRLRIHTRVPIILPSRINDTLINGLTELPIPTTLVIHCNHPQELDEEVCAALQRLRGCCQQLLNQSVLLAGVNDHVDTLARLSNELFAARVLPYYLHALDTVSGAAHYQVSEQRSCQLMRELATRLPGYLLPRLVRTVPNMPHKVLVV